MGSVIPLKKSANSAYLELKNLVGNKLTKVEDLIELKLKSKVDLINKMSIHHFDSGGKRLRAMLTLGSARLAGYELGNRDINLAPCVELKYSKAVKPSLKFEIIGLSIISPEGLAIKPLIPANCFI